MLRATEAVRSRLMALAGPEHRKQIQRVLAAIAEDAQHEAGFQNQHDYTEAQAHSLAMRAAGELNEAAIFEAAKAGRYMDLVAQLALLCGSPLPLVERLLQNGIARQFSCPAKPPGCNGRLCA